ncbi:MAG: hypothetical protein IJW67_00470, partial [Blautia sp.]|nr:hypothetical protein [Blautia sp.]
EELPDALFYSFYSDSIKIYYWEEMEYLVLDVTFGDTEFEVLSLQGETWETKYTTSEDLSFLPYLVFQPIEPEEEASSNILKLTE